MTDCNTMTVRGEGLPLFGHMRFVAAWDQIIRVTDPTSGWWTDDEEEEIFASHAERSQWDEMLAAL